MLEADINEILHRSPDLRSVTLPILLLLSLAIGGCAGYSAPIISLDQPPSIRIVTHQVSRGDTLYSIAWRYDLDFRELGAANGLYPPYELKTGQVLSLDTSSAKPVARARKSSESSNRSRQRASTTSSPAQSAVKTAVYSKNLQWQWPVEGKVVEDYDPKKLRKGLSIKSVSGSMVHPAAPGIVVYVGDGLRGYGKLVIVKHSDLLLSAYAHNEKIMVKEGQNVKNTEIISKLGPKGTLYFEIREDGYPVNPTIYID